VAWFGAVGGIGVAPHFNFQVLQRRAVIGLKQVIQNLAALRFRVVDQQSRRGPGADSADPLKDPSLAVPIDFDCRLLGWLLAGRKANKYGSQRKEQGMSWLHESLAYSCEFNTAK
jgi:hypothetical protein